MLRMLKPARLSIVLAALAVVCVVMAKPATARPNYLKEFKNNYITDETSPEYKKLVLKEAKCYVCHQGRKKKNRNIYGMAFDGLIEEKEKDAAKILDAIKKVGKMTPAMVMAKKGEGSDKKAGSDKKEGSGKKDAKSMTFDEIIASGKLPGGELEDLKKEPTKDGSDKKEGSDKK